MLPWFMVYWVNRGSEFPHTARAELKHFQTFTLLCLVSGCGRSNLQADLFGLTRGVKPGLCHSDLLLFVVSFLCYHGSWYIVTILYCIVLVLALPSSVTLGTWFIFEI